MTAETAVRSVFTCCSLPRKKHFRDHLKKQVESFILGREGEVLLGFCLFVFCLFLWKFCEIILLLYSIADTHEEKCAL